MMHNLREWWQNLPLNMNPVFVQFGPVQIRYYGLMFLSAFLTFYFLMRYRIRRDKVILSAEQLDDYLVWAIAGALLGGRLGYVLFYDFFYFLKHPVQIFWPFHQANGQAYFGISGLSFHGGLLGVFLATFLFTKKRGLSLWQLGDAVVPAVPLGYTFGRLGNFFNGELYGRVTDVPWGMYFPADMGVVLRHPSQLYEAFFEGLVLFTIIWSVRNKRLFDGWLFWLYLTLYGTFRFFIEFVRQPDQQLGFVLGPLSMGQVLCLVMVGVGVFEIFRKRKVWRKT